MNTKEESGMHFIVDCKSCFDVEESEIYKGINHCSVKTVDFILQRDNNNNIYFIEAKSSFPKIENSETTINEILEKFVHSFNLYLLLKVKYVDALPEIIKNNNIAHNEYKLALIIRKHKKEWLLGVLEQLKIEIDKKFKYHMAIWKPEIMVLNEEEAKKLKFIK